VLADRYREYLSELQEYDLSVPAKAIRICAALLKMKAQYLEFEEEEEQEENPMDFEEEPMMEEEFVEERERISIRDGPDLSVPVKAKPRRRMQLDELKDALEDAVEVKQRREERQEKRAEMDQEFAMNEEDITQKLNSLLSSVKKRITSSEEKVDFDELVEKDRKERIEKFKHMLHLENDQKVRLIQEEFLGDLHIKPEEIEEASKTS
jgi:chromatin segregation and condensation protein Rec8/ScpA/Scc1 (kleisin family)